MDLEFNPKNEVNLSNKTNEYNSVNHAIQKKIKDKETAINDSSLNNEKIRKIKKYNKTLKKKYNNTNLKGIYINNEINQDLINCSLNLKDDETNQKELNSEEIDIKKNINIEQNEEDSYQKDHNRLNENYFSIYDNVDSKLNPYFKLYDDFKFLEDNLNYFS